MLRGGLASILAVLLTPGASFPAAKSEKDKTDAWSGAAVCVPLGAASAGEGLAWVNEAPLVNGATLFVGDRVRVGEKATASLQLPGGMVLAAPGRFAGPS